MSDPNSAQPTTGTTTKSRQLVYEIERRVNAGEHLSEVLNELVKIHNVKRATLKTSYYRNRSNTTKKNGHQKLMDKQENLLVKAIKCFRYCDAPFSVKEIIDAAKNLFNVKVSKTWVYQLQKRHAEQLQFCASPNNQDASKRTKFKTKMSSKYDTFKLFVDGYKQFLASADFKPENLIHYNETIINLTSQPTTSSDNNKLRANRVRSHKNLKQRIDTSCIGSVINFTTAKGMLMLSIYVFKSALYQNQKEEINAILEKDSNYKRLPLFTPTGRIDSTSFKQVLDMFSAEFHKIYSHGSKCLLLSDQFIAYSNVTMVAEAINNGVHMCFLPRTVSFFRSSDDDQPFASFEVLIDNLAGQILARKGFENKTIEDVWFKAATDAEPQAFNATSIMQSWKHTFLYPFDELRMLYRGKKELNHPDLEEGQAKSLDPNIALLITQFVHSHFNQFPPDPVGNSVFTSDDFIAYELAKLKGETAKSGANLAASSPSSTINSNSSSYYPPIKRAPEVQHQLPHYQSPQHQPQQHQPQAQTHQPQHHQPQPQHQSYPLQHQPQQHQPQQPTTLPYPTATRFATSNPHSRYLPQSDVYNSMKNLNSTVQYQYNRSNYQPTADEYYKNSKHGSAISAGNTTNPPPPLLPSIQCKPAPMHPNTNNTSNPAYYYSPNYSTNFQNQNEMVHVTTKRAREPTLLPPIMDLDPKRRKQF